MITLSVISFRFQFYVICQDLTLSHCLDWLAIYDATMTISRCIFSPFCLLNLQMAGAETRAPKLEKIENGKHASGIVHTNQNELPYFIHSFVHRI